MITLLTPNSLYLDLANSDKTTFDEWKTLAPLKPLLAQLPKAQKDEAMDRIEQSLADGAADSPECHGVFLSKLLKFAKQAVLPLFGEKQKSLTDLTLIREVGQFIPLVLSTSPIDRDAITTKTPFGFYAKTQEHIVIPKDPTPETLIAKNKVYHWTQGDKQFDATVNIEVLTKKEALVPEGKGPAYDELWKDGSLTGVVVTGSNLKNLASGVMDQYLAYYQQSGFEFDEKDASIDLPMWLKKEVTTGEADYLIKEAHSDGDEKNLFRLDRKARVKRGVRKIPASASNEKPKQEVIYLVYLNEANTGSEVFSNAEFGKCINERSKNPNNGQFIYFNTSCWSHTKAVYEIEAAQNSMLLDIPSTTTVGTFSNYSNNAERLLFSAFRQRKDYDGIRKALSENPDYKEKKANFFIFPDQYEYDQNILQLIKIPLKIQVDIRDTDGKPYSVEDPNN